MFSVTLGRECCAICFLLAPTRSDSSPRPYRGCRFARPVDLLGRDDEPVPPRHLVRRGIVSDLASGSGADLDPFPSSSLFCGVTVPKPNMPSFYSAWLYWLNPLTWLIS